MTQPPLPPPPPPEAYAQAAYPRPASPSRLRSPWLWAVAAVLAVVLLVAKFLVIPTLAASRIYRWADSQGVEFVAQGWSGSVLGLGATAEGVKVLASGPYARKELIEARAVEFDLSFLGGLFGSGWLSGVRLVEPQIYLERLPSGRWNWEGAARLKPEDSGSGFALAELGARQLALDWVESLSGNGKSSSLRGLQASLRLDRANGRSNDLRALIDDRSPASPISFVVPVSQGKLHFDGRGNLFHWSAGQGPAKSWTPSFEGRLDLENLPANAFVSLIPEVAIVPASGSLAGQGDLRLSEGKLECHADITYDNVTYALNPASPLVGRSEARLAAQLAGYQAHGRLEFDCGGKLDNPNYRPVQAFLIALIRQGLGKAPRTVRGLVEVEFGRYSGVVVDYA
nr:hypothetical protein [Thermoanaerobaculia bacterium]